MHQVNPTTRPTFIMGESSFGRMLMEKSQFWDMYVRRLWATPEGWFDFASAADAGIRIFLFVPEDCLRDHPEYRPYVVGFDHDVDSMVGGGKILVLDGGNCIWNPLQNKFPSELMHPDHKIARVTTGEFRQTFGSKRFTSLIPREFPFWGMKLYRVEQTGVEV
jgi:hypothetical protein